MNDDTYNFESDHETQEEAESAAASLREEVPDYDVRVRRVAFRDVQASEVTHQWRVESQLKSGQP